MRVRRVIVTRRTVVFRLTIEEISGFLAKLLYVLLRTSCSPGWDTAAPVRHLDARLSGFWPRACALGPADWSGWQPAQVKERHGCPRHRRSHFGRCTRILPNSIDAMQPVAAGLANSEATLRGRMGLPMSRRAWRRTRPCGAAFQGQTAASQDSSCRP